MTRGSQWRKDGVKAPLSMLGHKLSTYRPSNPFHTDGPNATASRWDTSLRAAMPGRGAQYEEGWGWWSDGLLTPRYGQLGPRVVGHMHTCPLPSHAMARGSRRRVFTGAWYMACAVHWSGGRDARRVALRLYECPVCGSRATEFTTDSE